MRSIPALLLVALSLFLACGSGGGGGEPDSLLPQEVEPNDDPASALDLGSSFPLTAAGAAAPGDRDHFRFATASAGRLRARLTLPAGADLDLALLDGAGRLLATARADNTDPRVGTVERLFARIPAAGDRVLAVIGHSGEAGDYELRIEFAPDAQPAESGAVATASMKGPRCFHGLAPLPDGGAIVGGGTTNATSQASALLYAVASTEVFDPVAGTFADGPALGSVRFGVTATALSDGRVLFAGGDVAGTAALYDPESNGIVKADIQLAGGNRFLHTATLLPDGRVLLAGGVRLVIDLPPRAERLKSTTIFDPKTLATVAGPSLGSSRLSHAASLLPDGRVLITGGENRASTEFVDLRNGASAAEPGPELAVSRDDHTATTLADGRVLVAGGQDGRGVSLDTAEILEDGEWRVIPARMGAARSDHQDVRLPDGRVLLLGGERDPGGGPDEILDTVEVFDPEAGTFSSGPALAVPRDDHRAILLPDGRLLVTGGENSDSRGMADAERYSLP